MPDILSVSLQDILYSRKPELREQQPIVLITVWKPIRQRAKAPTVVTTVGVRSLVCQIAVAGDNFSG